MIAARGSSGSGRWGGRGGEGRDLSERELFLVTWRFLDEEEQVRADRNTERNGKKRKKWKRETNPEVELLRSFCAPRAQACPANQPKGLVFSWQHQRRSAPLKPARRRR